MSITVNHLSQAFIASAALLITAAPCTARPDEQVQPEAQMNIRDEVLKEAVGVELGAVENFATLLNRNPQADQTFWRVWYFGSIPWQRETITPASLLRDARLHMVFDGSAQ